MTTSAAIEFRDVRRDVQELFDKGPLFGWARMTHTPFLVIEPGRVTVEEKGENLLRLDDATHVMFQWEGQWRSDWFVFTVGELRAYVAGNPDRTKYMLSATWAKGRKS